VYWLSLYTHLSETEAVDYLRETYRILRSDGILYMTFFVLSTSSLVDAGHSSIGAVTPMWKARDTRRRPSPTMRRS
jgi:hypothetical protein